MIDFSGVFWPNVTHVMRSHELAKFFSSSLCCVLRDATLPGYFQDQIQVTLKEATPFLTLAELLELAAGAFTKNAFLCPFFAL